MQHRLLSPKRSSSYLWRIPLIYGLLGLAWIYGSDTLINSSRLHLPENTVHVFQTVKGMLYVVCSTAILYGLLFRFYRRMDDAGLLYRRLYAASPMPMLLVDQDSAQILVVNDAALRWYGRTRSELVGLSIQTLLKPANPTQEIDLLALAQAGEYDCGLWAHPCYDGLPSFARAYTTQFSHKKKTSVLLLLVDQTEHMRAEQQAFRYAERLTQTQDNVSDGYFTLGPDWRILAINKAFERMTGYTREHAVGQYIWDLFPESEERLFPPMYKIAMEKRESVYFEEFDPVTKLTFYLSVYPVPEGIAIYARNITDQIEARERQRAHERELNAVINATDDAVWYIDAAFQVRISNATYNRLRESALGPETPKDKTNAAPYTPGSNVSEVLRHNYLLALRGQHVHFEFELPFRDGTRRIYDAALNPVIDDAGAVIGVGCFARDITLRKEHENLILAQNRHLRRIAWYQSHLVRGPVASILGLVGLYDKQNPLEPFNQEIVDHLRITAQKLDKVIRNIVSTADEAYIPTEENLQEVSGSVEPPHRV